MLRTMFYPKNVPNTERIFRLFAGFVLIGIGLFSESLFGIESVLLIGLLLVSAIFTMITGFIGWCPACAMVGRKIKIREHAK